MGTWAVDGWRKEFGNRREYRNIPYYSDLSRFDLPRSRSSGNVRRFIYSGSLIARKGVDLLARAFAQVALTRHNIQLDLIGIGELEPMLRQEFAAVSDRVRFLGFRDWPELPAVYQTADILVAPSRYDGWGLVVPEGLAAGLPVIGTDRMGAVIDLLRPGHNGWQVPAGEFEPLVAALADAADISIERLREMSHAAKASVANHTLAHGVDEFVQGVSGALSQNDPNRVKSC
jgi:glycosyltransferase involved in cell wall biosynthesis